MLLNFQVIVDSLMKFEASRPDEHLNAGEARLEYFIDVLLRLVTGAGPHVAPDGHRLYNVDAEGLQGLLNDEPAKTIEVDIVYIPDGVNKIGVDVEDEQGNKFVWDSYGKSHVIPATTDAVTELASTEKSVSPGAKTSTLAIEAPQQRPKLLEGFGFEYPDTEFVNEESNRSNHLSEN